MDLDQFVYRRALADHPTRIDGLFASEEAAREHLLGQAETLARHHDYLMAHHTYGLMLIFQGMDAAGKDEAIRSIMTAVDPQGCEVKLYKPPGEKELRHDYLWRSATSAPARGQIGIFNRSYYEHVVTERVHPDRIDDQHLPAEARQEIYEKRYRHICDYERYLDENGIKVVKLYFHISKEAQRERLLERIDRPEKRWHFAKDDLVEREYWPQYMDAYDEAFRRTSAPHARWHIIPADERWTGRAIASTIIATVLTSLHSGYPEPTEDLEAARRKLTGS
jgi:PPK2 family polyphosphate:nucleotide phosphotransferase